MNLYKILIVGGGGFLGSVGRYMTVRYVDVKVNHYFPYGTLLVNVLGSFLLGIIYVTTLRNMPAADNWRLFLGAGFCGGFTTFSSFALENFNLLEQKMVGASLAYIAASLVAGLLSLAAGVWVARFL